MGDNMTLKAAAARGPEAGAGGFAYTMINRDQQLDTELAIFWRKLYWPEGRTAKPGKPFPWNMY